MVADSARAPSPNVTVTRDRRPKWDQGRLRRLSGDRGSTGGRWRRGRKARMARPSGGQLVAHTPHGEDVAGIGGVGLDLGAQPPDMDVDGAPVAEGVGSPPPVAKQV